MSSSSGTTRQRTPSTNASADVFGDVYICQFPFTSGVGTKVRPALVLFDLQQDAVICRITSVLRARPLDVTLNDWQAAGLLKPSVARFTHHTNAYQPHHRISQKCSAGVSGHLQFKISGQSLSTKFQEIGSIQAVVNPRNSKVFGRKHCPTGSGKSVGRCGNWARNG